MKLQNFEFKNYLNHYLKRGDHFLGSLKFLHTVSVEVSDINYFLTLIKHYFCSQFYNYMYTCYLEIIKWTKILGQENKQDWLQNFEFKNHYLKRSDHFLGSLKFLHTISVSSSDSQVTY
jgi:hypothetical protein